MIESPSQVIRAATRNQMRAELRRKQLAAQAKVRRCPSLNTIPLPPTCAGQVVRCLIAKCAGCGAEQSVPLDGRNSAVNISSAQYVLRVNFGWVQRKRTGWTCAACIAAAKAGAA